MHAATAYEANEKLIRRFAGQVLRRVHAAGLRSMQIDDIRQELSIAWMTAAERWQPDVGVPFGAYLLRGMRLHINRWVKRELDAHGVAPFSIDMEVRHERTGDGGHDPLFVRNRAESKDLNPEEQLARNQTRRLAEANLSDEARTFIRLLENPPDALLREVEAVQARLEYGRSRGIATWGRSELSSRLIFDLMGATKGDRDAVVADIKLFCEITQ